MTDSAELELVKRYRLLREAGRALFGKAIKEVPHNIFMRAANEFRFMKKGTLACDQSDLDVLGDRIFYDTQWEGTGAVEHYIAVHGLTSLTDTENEFYQAMKRSLFSLFLIKGRGQHSLLLSDRLSANAGGTTLMDINLSLSAALDDLFATRLLDFEDFSMTSGVGYPFRIQHEADIIAYLREKDAFNSKKRINQPEKFPLYFYKLHRALGEKVVFEDY